jgi:hypothetical protein
MKSTTIKKYTITENASPTTPSPMKPTVEAEFLNNGNLRIGGPGGFEIEPPDGHPARARARWAMKDARGNLIVGSYREGVEPVLVLRDPTTEEADDKIDREMTELQRSGEAVSASAALKMACDRWPLHAKVYCAPRRPTRG